MQQIKAIWLELNRFSDDMVTFNDPVKEEAITQFEEEYNLMLPLDFKAFLRLSNGLTLCGSDIYGFGNREYGENLNSVYFYEHFNVVIAQFDFLVPFSPDGGGNFYCLDCRKISQTSESCPVVFWVSNYDYMGNDMPEVTNDSFSGFINEYIIGWTLDDYDYDGKGK